MSAQRAYHIKDGVANSNAAARQPMILFLDRELVHTHQTAVVPALTEISGFWRFAAYSRDKVIHLLRKVTAWNRRARGRRALASLDSHMRRDLGLTELDVWREANKPFWRD